MDSGTIHTIIDRIVSSYDLNDYSTFYDLVDSCIDRVELDDLLTGDTQEIGFDAVDTTMIYYDDQWDLLRAVYLDPRDANFDEAMESLTNAVIETLDEIQEQMIEEKREELQTSMENIRKSIIQLHNAVMELQDELDSVKYDDCFDDLVDYHKFDELENQLTDIEAFLSEYDVINSCEEDTTSEEEIEDLELLNDEDIDDEYDR